MYPEPLYTTPPAPPAWLPINEPLTMPNLELEFLFSITPPLFESLFKIKSAKILYPSPDSLLIAAPHCPTLIL